MMIKDIFDVLFGCSHKHCSFPITTKPGQRRIQAAAATGTYVVCLDCGQEFAYDWQEMRMVTGREKSGQLTEATQPFAKSA